MAISYFDPQTTEHVEIGSVLLGLTEDELHELSDALTHMLEAPERGPDSHYHLSDSDGQEVTVWVFAPQSTER
jgi:hypothetical protein